MPEVFTIVRLTAFGTLASVLITFSACQPIGDTDPLDQDAFATESAALISADR